MEIRKSWLYSWLQFTLRLLREVIVPALNKIFSATDIVPRRFEEVFLANAIPDKWIALDKDHDRIMTY
jgi:hypothetical protein